MLILLAGKGSPKDPGDAIGKVLKLLFELPNADLGPLFSSSTFWLVKAGAKAGVLVVTGFEKIKFELAVELFVTCGNKKRGQAARPATNRVGKCEKSRGNLALGFLRL